ncbi:MAG: leucine-rich repeat protein [bacterium]
MKDVFCIKCSNKEQINKVEGKYNCSKCGCELNVEESQLIATFSENIILNIQKKIKKIETTDDYDLCLKIGQLYEDRLIIAKDPLNLAISKGNIDAMYTLANSHIIHTDKSRSSANILQEEKCAYDLFMKIKESGDEKISKRLLMFPKDKVENPVRSVSGWRGPRSINVELEDIIKIDPYLEVLRNHEEIQIVTRDLIFQTSHTFRDKTAYDLKCLVVNDYVKNINNAIFNSVDTLVYLGEKGFPNLEGFYTTKVKEVIFINSGFLSGKKYLCEGCDYIINNFTTFNDKENFIKTLSKNNDKMKDLTKEIILKSNINVVKFLIDNNIVKYEVLMNCLTNELSNEKKLIIMDSINKSSEKDKVDHIKKEERKENLDLGFTEFSIKDFKNTFTCAIKDDFIEIGTYKLNEESIVFPGVINKVSNYFIKKQKDNLNVKKIYFEEGVKVIKGTDASFHNFSFLEEIYLPSTLEYIDEDVLESLRSSVNVYIGEDKKYVICNDNTLLRVNGLENLKDVIIPEGVKSIKKRLFKSTSITSVSFPKSIQTINSGVFSFCGNLKNVEFAPLDDNLVIGTNVFSFCESLKVVNLPEGTTHLKDTCFSSCKNLNELNIPSTLSVIESGVFEKCSSLNVISISDENKNLKLLDKVLYSDNQVIKVLKEFDKKSLTILEGITSISMCAFEDMKTLNSIILPESLEVISSFAFNGCSNLLNINLPINIKEIGYAAFKNTNLSKVILPNITKVESATFAGCKLLSELYIPNTVTKIGEEAFLHCESLISFEIPTSVTRMDRMAFSLSSDSKTKGVIYTELKSQPADWNRVWSGGRKIEWGNKKP